MRTYEQKEFKHKFVFIFLPIILLVSVIVTAYIINSRTKLPPAEILGKSAYVYEGKQVYEIRTYHGYHKLTKDKYEKYNVGDKYE